VCAGTSGGGADLVQGDQILFTTNHWQWAHRGV
jgi:hypothetical protein